VTKLIVPSCATRLQSLALHQTRNLTGRTGCLAHKEPLYTGRAVDKAEAEIAVCEAMLVAIG